MKKYKLIFILIIVFTLAAIENNPTVMGSSWSNGSLLKGIDALRNNPANLGLSDNVNSSMTFLFMPMPNISISSENSISLSIYNDYVSEDGDNLWSPADVDKILDQLDGKWRVQNNVDIDIFSMTKGNKGLSLTANSIENIAVPEDILELLLKGIRVGKVYDAEELNGEAYNSASLGLSYARLINQSWIDKYFKEFSVGGTLRFIHSLPGTEMDNFDDDIGGKIRPAYIKIDNVDAYVVVNDVSGGNGSGSTGTKVKGSFDLQVSEAGMGFGTDLGMTGILSHNENMRVGLTISNLFSMIDWYKDNRTYKYRYLMDGIYISDLNGTDSLFTIQDQFSVESDDFYTYLPPELKLDYAWKLYPGNQNFFWTSSYIQGFKNELYSTTMPKFSTGFEWYHNSADWFRLRSGITLGGESLYSSAAGISFVFTHYTMDFAIDNKYLYGDDSKGLSFAIGQKLLW